MFSVVVILQADFSGGSWGGGWGIKEAVYTTPGKAPGFAALIEWVKAHL